MNYLTLKSANLLLKGKKYSTNNSVEKLKNTFTKTFELIIGRCNEVHTQLLKLF